MLVDEVVARVNHGLTTDPPTVASPPSNGFLAHLSLFGRYMKAQRRLAGDRRKLGRNGFGSDIPRG